MAKGTASRRWTMWVVGIGCLVLGGCGHVTELYRHGGAHTVFYDGGPGELEQRLATCGAVIRTIDPTTPRSRASIVLHEPDRLDPAGLELRVWVSQYQGGTLMIVDQVVTRTQPDDDEAAIRSAMEWFRLCQSAFHAFSPPGRDLQATLLESPDELRVARAD